MLRAALAVEPDDVAAVENAGGKLIGFHATRQGYGLRAASVGGTHFVAVAGVETVHSNCAATAFRGSSFISCSSRGGRRPTKIAVFRVPIGDWRRLPPHLVPPTSDVLEGMPVDVTRSGCNVGNGWGNVVCDDSWRIVQH